MWWDERFVSSQYQYYTSSSFIGEYDWRRVGECCGSEQMGGVWMGMGFKAAAAGCHLFLSLIQMLLTGRLFLSEGFPRVTCFRCRVGENWWYRGEHCEEYVSEPLVVGIAIASVAGFLLVASGVIFFLARTLRDQYDTDDSEDPSCHSQPVWRRNFKECSCCSFPKNKSINIWELLNETEFYRLHIATLLQKLGSNATNK